MPLFDDVLALAPDDLAGAYREAAAGLAATLAEMRRNADVAAHPRWQALRDGREWQANEARKAVEAWLVAELAAGTVTATGYTLADPLQRVAIASELWTADGEGRRRLLLRRTGELVDRGSKAVVATGLRFEAAAPKRGPGRPKAEAEAEAVGDPSAERALLSRAPAMTRVAFRAEARRVWPDRKAVEIDAIWQQLRPKNAR